GRSGGRICSPLTWIGEPVTGARHGGYEVRLTDGFSQCRDRHTRRGRERVGVFVPGLFQERLSADNATASTHQQLEDGKLLTGQPEVAPGAVGFAPKRIQREVRELERAWHGRGWSACQRLEPGDELLER